MNISQIQQALNERGFPCGTVDGDLGPRSREAVKRFQAAYCGPGGWLDEDGIAGPRTQEALQWMVDTNGHLSTHFTAKEAACHHCGLAYVRKELLSALEELREAFDQPIKIVDMYRCPEHNKAVGGAGASQHTEGKAADLATLVPLSTARRVSKFRGIGRRGNYASHVDVRSGSAAAWAY